MNKFVINLKFRIRLYSEKDFNTSSISYFAIIFLLNFNQLYIYIYINNIRHIIYYLLFFERLWGLEDKSMTGNDVVKYISPTNQSVGVDPAIP